MGNHGDKQVEAWKFSQSFNKEPPSIKPVNSNKRLNTEIINEIKWIEEQNMTLKIKMKYITNDAKNTWVYKT